MLISGLAPGKAPFICGVIVKSIDNLDINKALRAGANMLEFRLDTFSKREIGLLPKVLKRLKARKIPLLLTIRSVKEGGKGKLTNAERLSLYKEFIPLFDAVDIELSSGSILKKVIREAKEKGKLIIVSFHNFKRTPKRENLLKTIKEARRADANIVKIAVMIKDKEELKMLAGVLINNKDLIVIAMGSIGRPSRVFFPMLGSLITYAGISQANAPGQVSISKLKSEFKFFDFN